MKKLAFFIARNAKSGSRRTQRKVKSAYRTLIDRVEWIAGVAEEAQQRLALAFLTGPELEAYTPIVRRVADQAERRVFQGEKVPVSEKVYSLFKEHAELLKQGKAPLCPKPLGNGQYKLTKRVQ